jgi:hypothetical protein
MLRLLAVVKSVRTSAYERALNSAIDLRRAAEVARGAAGVYASPMKPARAAVPPEKHPCQWRACLNVGKSRSQSRGKVLRTLYLCDECFGLLPAHQLNDLFLQIIGEQK